MTYSPITLSSKSEWIIASRQTGHVARRTLFLRTLFLRKWYSRHDVWNVCPHGRLRSRSSVRDSRQKIQSPLSEAWGSRSMHTYLTKAIQSAISALVQICSLRTAAPFPSATSFMATKRPNWSRLRIIVAPSRFRTKFPSEKVPGALGSQFRERTRRQHARAPSGLASAEPWLLAVKWEGSAELGPPLLLCAGATNCSPLPFLIRCGEHGGEEVLGSLSHLALVSWFLLCSVFLCRFAFLFG